MKTSSLAFALVLLFSISACAVDATPAEPAAAAPPAEEDVGAVAQDWDAESATNETDSTHLWIVDRALDLLSSRTDLPLAASIVSVMNAPGCRSQWQQGLLDADFLAAYNNGFFDTKPGDPTAKLLASGATWKSHFYDPDTGRNYEGETSPTARTQAARFLAAATTDWAARRTASACYELGLSLHYMTDATQPMHASNFTAKDRALSLHTNVESYAMQVQDAYVVHDARFVGLGAPGALSPDATLVASARTSKALWPGLRASIYSAYQHAGLTCYLAYKTWLVDRPSCWKKDADVDQQIGVSLSTAQTSTASYIYAVSSAFR